MFVAIDGIAPQRSQSGRRYFSFWAKLYFDDELSINVSGFKYYPDTKTISTPSVNKGGDKFINTAKLSGKMYNAIREAAETAIAPQAGALEPSTNVAA